MDLVFLVARVRRPLRTARATRHTGEVTWHLRNGASFVVRGRSSDMLAVREVILRNTHRLPAGALGVVVDIGAHIGTFTARVSHRATRVIAFEATSANHALLSRCGSAKAALDIHHSAVTGDGRPVRMHLHPENTGQHSLFQHEPPADAFEDVPSVSSADVVAIAGGRIDLLKVDVEGAEHEILTRELLAATQHLIVEVNETAARSRAQLTEKMELSGFTVTSSNEVVHATRGG